MKQVAYEITEEEYNKALSEGPTSIISDSIVMGYGVYGAAVTEANGKYYLSYERGDSCE